MGDGCPIPFRIPSFPLISLWKAFTRRVKSPGKKKRARERVGVSSPVQAAKPWPFSFSRKANSDFTIPRIKCSPYLVTPLNRVVKCSVHVQAASQNLCDNIHRHLKLSLKQSYILLCSCNLDWTPNPKGKVVVRKWWKIQLGMSEWVGSSPTNDVLTMNRNLHMPHYILVHVDVADSDGDSCFKNWYFLFFAHEQA